MNLKIWETFPTVKDTCLNVEVSSQKPSFSYLHIVGKYLRKCTAFIS